MRTRLGILIDETRICAVAVRRSHVVWAATAAYKSVDDLRSALSALAAERPRAARSAAVALGGSMARVKTVHGLPPLKREDLAAHVQLNSRRYFLQNGIPLVTDALPLPSAGDGHSALLAGAQASIVDAVIDGLDAAGIACARLAPAEQVCPPGDDPVIIATRVAAGAAPALSLLPPAARARDASRLQVSARRWVVFAACALALAVAARVGANARAGRRAETDLAAIAPAVNAAIAVRADFYAASEALAVAGRAESANAHRARFLAALARALPDSAFLVSLELDADGGGMMSGYAPGATATLARLERELHLRNPTLTGAVTREVQAGRELERFTIRFGTPPGTLR